MHAGAYTKLEDTVFCSSCNSKPAQARLQAPEGPQINLESGKETQICPRQRYDSLEGARPGRFLEKPMPTSDHIRIIMRIKLRKIF